MARIRIVRAAARYQAEGKRFQTVIENDTGRVISRAKPTRTKQLAAAAAPSLYYAALLPGTSTAEARPYYEVGPGGEFDRTASF